MSIHYSEIYIKKILNDIKSIAVVGAHRDDSLGIPELSLETVTQLQDALNAIHSGRLKSSGVYPVTYKVNDRVELLSEPSWLQDWDPSYPELKIDTK